MRKIKLKSIISLLYTISTLILMFAAYQTDSTLGNDLLREFLKIILYICAFVGLSYSFLPILSGKRKIIFQQLLLIISFALYYFLMVFHSYDGRINVSGFLSLILVIGFIFLPNEDKKKSYVLFRNAWVIISIISIVCYISYSLNLFLPYKIVKYYSLLNNTKYIDYYVAFLYKDGNLIRLCGICNEPGYFGTVSALVLCACGLNLKDKKNIICFIAGLLSFSFAFFIIILIYLLLKSWKNWKIFFLMLLLLFGYVYILPNLDFKNDNINYLLYRFTISDDGLLRGDNRSNSELDNVYLYVIKNRPIFGLGSNYIKQSGISGVGSYKIYVVEYGLLGCALMWGLLLVSALLNNKKNINILLFIAVFFISIYQRANIMMLPYLLILFGGIEYIKVSFDNKSLEQKQV